MTDQADTQSAQAGNGVPPAGAQELSIPKHRFDEVNARLQEQKRELEMKNELLNRLAQNQAPQQAQRQQLTPEELGLDPQTFQAAQRIAASMIDDRVSGITKQFNSIIGQLGNDMEETKFLQQFPKASGYLAAIREKKIQHSQATGGGFLDAVSAYKMIRFDEMESRGSAAPAPSVQQTTAAPAPAQPQGNYPSAAATRTSPGAAAGAESGGSAEETLEEMEARLNAGMKSGIRM